MRLLGDLRQHSIDLQQPIVLFFVTSALSNIVGNNPAVMLLVPYTSGPRPDLTAAAMALGMGFSSNMIVFGSLVGIVVVEEARKRGVDISFRKLSPLRRDGSGGLAGKRCAIKLSAAARYHVFGAQSFFSSNTAA